jgi:hypothetical protein
MERISVGDVVLWHRRIRSSSGTLLDKPPRLATVLYLKPNGCAGVRLVGGKGTFHTHIMSLEPYEP